MAGKHVPPEALAEVEPPGHQAFNQLLQPASHPGTTVELWDDTELLNGRRRASQQGARDRGPCQAAPHPGLTGLPHDGSGAPQATT